MDFEVPVRKKYATDSQEICSVSCIYNKECIKEFLAQWISSKVVFVRNAHGQALVYIFYQLRMFIIQSNEKQAFKVH